VTGERGAAWRDRAWGRPLVLGLAVALAAAIVGVSEVGYRRALAVLAEREASLTLRAEVSRLQRVMLAAEAGQRGYLLTARPQYKDPYVASLAAFEESLGQIAAAYGEAPDRKREALQLEELARKKMSELETTLALFEQGKIDATRELLLTDIGREQMAQIDALAAEVGRRETVLLAETRRILDRTLLTSRVGTLVLVAAALAAWFTLVRQARHLARERAERAAALQAERDRLEVEVERRTQELRQVATHLQTAREDERERLARELHDELGGLLTAAKLDLARLRHRLDTSPAEAAEPAGQIAQALDAGIALKRRIIEDLHPSALAQLGLAAALEILCREFAERSEIAVDCHAAPGPLDSAAALTVYRLVQESLTNVAKHAGARRVQVTVADQEGGTTVAVHDDGGGFDPETATAGAHGLAGMRFRVQSHRGRLGLRSAPGDGTTITAWLPASSGG